MDPATVSQTKSVENGGSDNVADVRNNETYDEEEDEDQEENSTFQNKTKKLIRSEKSASTNKDDKCYSFIFVLFITFCLELH